MPAALRSFDIATVCNRTINSLLFCSILVVSQNCCTAQIEVFNNQADFEFAAAEVSSLKAIEDFDSASNLVDEPAIIVESDTLLPGVPFVDELGRGFPNGLQESEDIAITCVPSYDFVILNSGVDGLTSVAVGPNNAIPETVIEVITGNDINIGFDLLSTISNSTSFTIIVLDPNNKLLYFDNNFSTGTNGLDGFIGFVTDEKTTIAEIWLENNSGFPEELVDNIQIWQRTLKGDVNQDGVVNLLDVDPFIQQFSSGVYLAEADTNCDGQLNLLDVAPFIAILNGN